MENKLRYCGRDFFEPEIEKIRDIISSDDKPNRAKISRRVCREFSWVKHDGGLKEMSCRVALLRMQNDGLVELPKPTKKNGNKTKRNVKLTDKSNPRTPILLPVHELAKLHIEQLQNRADSLLYNEYISRYHYLGYDTLPGAQIRYFIKCNDEIIGAMGFGAAAWKVACRDKWIGWDPVQRKKKLHLIVNNARFLIFPWINSKNLASKALAIIAKRLPCDWQRRYSYTPLLLETFVQNDKFKGTCYKAANWKMLGNTAGRGKLDSKNEKKLPVKSVFTMPLTKAFRSGLCG
jgi:hypothetical protein